MSSGGLEKLRFRILLGAVAFDIPRSDSRGVLTIALHQLLRAVVCQMFYFLCYISDCNLTIDERTCLQSKRVGFKQPSPAINKLEVETPIKFVLLMNPHCSNLYDAYVISQEAVLPWRDAVSAVSPG